MTAPESGPSRTKFNEAASYLSSASSLSKVTNATKLELYGLFKYVTVSPSPNTSRPSIFDMTGRAKWDAWASAGKTHANVLHAENRYLQLARELGWKEGDTSQGSDTAQTTQAQDNKKEDESIWDDDADPSQKKRSGGGMGNRVSTVAQEDEEHREEDAIHSVVLSGDRTQLEIFLISHPKTDLNQVDEYGYTPLHLAADRGHLEVVQLLLSRGANPDLKDEDEYTALEIAQIAGHDEVVALLKAT